MPDKFGFSQSDMTAEGWSDYQRALSELAAQRNDKTSRHAARVHCSNGYVDVLARGKYTNGSSVGMDVDSFRTKVRNEGHYIYDYNYR